MKTAAQVLEDLISTIESNAIENKASISNVKLWASSWRKELALELGEPVCYAGAVVLGRPIILSCEDYERLDDTLKDRYQPLYTL